jgi:hypothetical protein
MEEARTPPIACPKCGTPLALGHCSFCGWQAEIVED